MRHCWVGRPLLEIGSVAPCARARAGALLVVRLLGTTGGRGWTSAARPFLLSNKYGAWAAAAAAAAPPAPPMGVPGGWAF